MLVIRLSRKGRRNHPMYRLLVAENSKPTDGSFVEIVGHYNPTAQDQPLTVNKERVQYWISKGAQPTNSVSKLLNRTGFDLSVEEKHRKPKKEPQVVEATPAAGTGSSEETTGETAPAAEEASAVVAEESPAVTETPAAEEKPAEPEVSTPASDESEKSPEA